MEHEPRSQRITDDAGIASILAIVRNVQIGLGKVDGILSERNTQFLLFKQTVENFITTQLAHCKIEEEYLRRHASDVDQLKQWKREEEVRREMTAKRNARDFKIALCVVPILLAIAQKIIGILWVAFKLSG